MTAFVETAVEALRAYYAAQLPAELAIVETEDSLDAGTLTAPVTYLGYEDPNDNRSPLIEVYETSVRAQDQRCGIWDVSINADLTCNFADASMATSFVTMRRYFTALMRVPQRARWCVTGVIECVFVGAERGLTIGGQSAGRHVWRFKWIVSVQSRS
jgi:hypothetical protein